MAHFMAGQSIRQQKENNKAIFLLSTTHCYLIASLWTQKTQFQMFYSSFLQTIHRAKEGLSVAYYADSPTGPYMCPGGDSSIFLGELSYGLKHLAQKNTECLSPLKRKALY
jgi:hypothetical protein